ncbi:Hypothetical_protein [Hexamita inflata]|uniref:Hypothetical_protein n=1 Tax=Hexamita inflata TaxID=28002 RepID=A0AA86NRY8_9EUKA|nr:Hypothetical protein HINF_LOCUS12508 [Hexamita inflata]
MPCFSEKRETTKMQRSVKNSNQFQLLFQGSSQILVNIKMRILIQWQKERLERSSLSLYRHFRCGVERLPAELQFQYSPEYKSLPGEKVPTGLKNRVARQLQYNNRQPINQSTQYQLVILISQILNIFSASQVPSIPKQCSINSQNNLKQNSNVQNNTKPSELVNSQQKPLKMQPTVSQQKDAQNISIQNPPIQVNSQQPLQQQSYQIQQQMIIPTFPEIQQSRQPIDYKYQLPQQQLGSTDYKYVLPSTQQYNNQNNNDQNALNEQGQQVTHKKVVRKVRRKVHIEKKTDEQSDSNTQAAVGAEL